MASIIIKELYDSDNIYVQVEKINFNFDQLIAAGGGPAGPIGLQGVTGPAGPQGIRGNEWFASDGATGTINLPTDGEFRDNDFKLDVNGDIEYYDGGSWVSSGLNIKGPTGPTGAVGNGSISTIHSEVSPAGKIVPNVSDGSKLRLSDHLAGLDPNNDSDDYDDGIGYINSGIDYTLLGYGNNSLVLGRYSSMFRDNGVFNPYFNSWPSEEKDVPMLIIAQNDYQNPVELGAYDVLPEFTNGIAIGLNRTQDNAYSSIYSGVDYFGDYESFTKIGILNRNFDFGVQSVGHIELRSRGSNKIRLSAGYTRNEIKEITDVTQWSNLFSTDTYTEILAGDNIVIAENTDQDNVVAPGIPKQFINVMGLISLSSTYEVNLSNNLLSSINSTVFGRNGNPFNSSQNANELIIVNDRIQEKETRSDKYNNRRRIDTSRVYSQREANNYRDIQLRLGQFRAKTSTSINTAKNLFYLGQGFDAPVIGYSSVNFRIPSGTYAMGGGTAAAWSLLPSSYSDFSYLGYNINDGFAPGGGVNVDTDKSLTRIGIFPGFLNRKRDALGNFDPTDTNSDKNLQMYLDEGHKKLPTGSLDLYGTVRIREYGLAEDKKDYVAINGGHGIIKWEENSKVGVPTGAIVMISDIAMSKFSFFTRTPQSIGAADGYTSGGLTAGQALSFWGMKSSFYGGTSAANFWTAALPGKGSDEWKGYYLCNGAILADSRDIFARGAFSTKPGFNAYGNNNQMPGLVKNDTYFTQFNTYSNVYYIDGKGYTSTASSFANNLIERANELADTFGEKGLSLLAPSDTDSKFRVVLPNYFGRFPKQMFPSSEVIHLANRDDAQPADGSGLRKPVTSYYKQDANGKYILNDKYPLLSAFYNGGFPYIRIENLPQHEHYAGISTAINVQTGSTNINFIRPGAFGSQESKAPFGSFNQVGGVVTSSGLSNAGTNGPYLPDGIIGGSASNDWYVGMDYTNRVYSNWENDIVHNAYRARSQKFHDPVFKGTYFVINLKGLRNPNRNNTIIPDFDFISGVPYCGFRNGTPDTYLDYSWYSIESDLIRNATYTEVNSPKTYIKRTPAVGNPTELERITPDVGDAARGRFQRIYRNENTMHPYTLIKESEQGYNKTLSTIYSNIYTQPTL